jgi:addiction module RelE/StbE family toxin
MKDYVVTENKRFTRDIKKLDTYIKTKFFEKFSLFTTGLYDELLNRHKLKGVYRECESINITGDFRLIFKIVPPNEIILIRIGTHSELYKG